MLCYFTPAGVSDLEEIGDYIAEDSPARARAFVHELRQRCERLCDFPYAYPLRPDVAPDIRVMTFRHYLICYTVHSDRVVIERVTQGSRDLAALFQ
jgi:toxin ParE1/3/4